MSKMRMKMFEQLDNSLRTIRERAWMPVYSAPPEKEMICLYLISFCLSARSSLQIGPSTREPTNFSVDRSRMRHRLFAILM